MCLLKDSYISFVNLGHRMDRLKRMEATLKKANIQAERARGLLPDEIKEKPERIWAMLRRPQKGAIGCHFSQVHIMEKALLQRKHAFVMEDDLVFCEDFHVRLQMMDDFIRNRQWDVLWLGGTFHINPPYWHKAFGRDAEQTSHPRFIRTFGAFCTYAYIVNFRSLPKVLAMLDEQLPTSIGIDYAFIQMQRRLHTFAFVPGCVTQYDNQSDIGQGITKFSGFSKLGPYWYQNRLDGFDPCTFNWHEATKKF